MNVEISENGRAPLLTLLFGREQVCQEINKNKSNGLFKNCMCGKTRTDREKNKW